MSEQSENIISKAEVLQDTVIQESTSAIVQASTEPNVTEQPQEPTLNVAPTEGVVTVEEAQPMPLPPPSSFEAAPAADNVNTPIPEGIVETPKASESPITANTTSEPVSLEKTISVEPLNKTKSKAALSKSKPKLKNGASKPSIIQAVETPIIETTAEVPKGEGETKLPNSNTDVQERIKKGIFPIFLTSTTQELFKLKPNEQLTPEKPFRFVHRADIQSDMQTRAAISDFYPAKQLIMDFPQDEILVHHDPEFFYGQNFFLVVTQDALDAILNPIVAVPENQSENTKANVRSPWNCLGSDKEMEAESIILNREAVVVRASREYRGFNQLCKFGDRNALEGYTECRPFRDPNYEVTRLELPVSCQAVPHVHDSSIQTTWYP